LFGVRDHCFIWIYTRRGTPAIPAEEISQHLFPNCFNEKTGGAGLSSSSRSDVIPFGLGVT
jgi:hypothetical protein